MTALAQRIIRNELKFIIIRFSVLGSEDALLSDDKMHMVCVLFHGNKWYTAGGEINAARSKFDAATLVRLLNEEQGQQVLKNLFTIPFLQDQGDAEVNIE